MPLFTGLPDYEVTRAGGERIVTYTNTGALFDVDGNVANRMDKIELVPFGVHPDGGKLAYYRESGMTECALRIPSAHRESVLPVLDEYVRWLD